MDENLKEIVEVRLKGEEDLTIDLSDRKVVVFCGDSYKNSNLIPEFILSTMGGYGNYVKEVREKLKYKSSDDHPNENIRLDIIHYFPLFHYLPDPKEVSKLGKTYYDFHKDIEYGKSPYEQIDFLENLLGKWDNWKTDPRKILISTNSPYILNYINVIMARDQELAEKISAYYVHDDYDVECLDSIGNKTNMRLINTIDLSEPMEYIFENYTEIESKILGKKYPNRK